MNLARETLDILKENGKTIHDVRWVGHYDSDRKKRISVDEFFVAAMRTNYDNDYGSPEIDTSLVVVGDDWWLERAEYDGSEWWEFKTLPKKEDYEEEPRYCDRNICTNNEYNGISCDECEIAKYHNLEDDDSPCSNCEREE